jgi:hypothetical protein
MRKHVNIYFGINLSKVNNNLKEKKNIGSEYVEKLPGK